MEGKDCKLMDEVKEVAAVMKDTVSYVQKSIKNLAGVHGMEEALKQVARVHDELDKKERDALQTMITANSQVGLAVHFARVAVRMWKSIVETVRRVITAENEKMSDKLKLALHIFFHRFKDLIPHLRNARDELVKCQDTLINSITGLEILKEWYNRKIDEMEGKAVFEVVKQQAIAFGGAAAAATFVGVGVAHNWWNPFSWVAGSVVIVGVAAVARGVVVSYGVTEELRKEYDSGITSLNEAANLFEEVSKNTKKSIFELGEKEKEMAALAESALNGEMIISFDEDGVEMFNIFRVEVFTLDQLCDDYLNAPDLF